MPVPIRTLDDTISWETTRLGQSRLGPNDWAAGSGVDDCALFQSAALWGARTVWNVDVFKTIDGGSYHPGKAGLQRGDLVLFDWNGNGLGDHVEMALESPNAAGAFQTIGANSSARADHGVAYNARSAYVLGYFRPDYHAPATPPPPAPKEPEMSQADIDTANAALRLAALQASNPAAVAQMVAKVKSIYHDRLGRDVDPEGMISGMRTLILSDGDPYKLDQAVITSPEGKAYAAKK